MTNPNELNINIDPDEIKKIAKKYKKLKKYMRSPLFEVKKIVKAQVRRNYHVVAHRRSLVSLPGHFQQSLKPAPVC